MAENTVSWTPGPARCHDCGRFFSASGPYAWKLIYSGYPPTPDHEVFRCPKCFAVRGEFIPQDGIKPEYSCGVIDAVKAGRVE